MKPPSGQTRCPRIPSVPHPPFVPLRLLFRNPEFGHEKGMKLADGAVAGVGFGAGIAAGAGVTVLAGIRAGEALSGVPRALTGSFEPTFCGPSTEMSVRRNLLALNASTAASALPWLGPMPNNSGCLPAL